MGRRGEERRHWVDMQSNILEKEEEETALETGKKRGGNEEVREEERERRTEMSAELGWPN
jgi:hypothetical protein